MTSCFVCQVLIPNAASCVPPGAPVSVLHVVIRSYCVYVWVSAMLILYVVCLVVPSGEACLVVPITTRFQTDFQEMGRTTNTPLYPPDQRPALPSITKLPSARFVTFPERIPATIIPPPYPAGSGGE